MFNRACRLLNPSSSQSQSSTSTTTERVATARLSEHERLSRWRVILLKVALMLQTAAQYNKTKALLGETVYNRLFSRTTQEVAKEKVKYRFIKGQAVGKALPPGQGRVDAQRASMDPAMCQHPTEHMQARGNAKEKWWICKACLQRWERLEMTQLQGLSPENQDLALLTFGKHMGETFQSVYQNDPAYCRWVLETVTTGDPSTELTKLAHYIHAKELEMTYEMDGYQVEAPSAMNIDQDL